MVELEGRKLDLVAVLVHGTLIWSFTFLTTLMGTALAGSVSVKAALLTAAATAAIKLIMYLAARTGTPLNGNGAPSGRGP